MVSLACPCYFALIWDLVLKLYTFYIGVAGSLSVILPFQILGLLTMHLLDASSLTLTRGHEECSLRSHTHSARLDEGRVQSRSA